MNQHQRPGEGCFPQVVGVQSEKQLNGRECPGDNRGWGGHDTSLIESERRNDV